MRSTTVSLNLRVNASNFDTVGLPLPPAGLLLPPVGAGGGLGAVGEALPRPREGRLKSRKEGVGAARRGLVAGLVRRSSSTWLLIN